jgi:alpha-tubulin suppressor-like RCC1 family protein
VDISVGAGHGCAVIATGRIYCWGENDSGQLGYGAYSVQAPPTRVSGNTAFASVSAGLTHTCALDQENGAWCWGSNTLGELGVGDLNNRNRPTRVLPVLAFPPD